MGKPEDSGMLLSDKHRWLVGVCAYVDEVGSDCP